ncbi:MAG: rhodanese-like domain-containing protein [Spirochaetia bacterium]
MKRMVFVLAAMVGLTFLAAAAGAEGATSGERYRDPSQLSRLVETGKPAYILVDVRTPEEFAAGHIPTAVNIPVTDIANRPPTKDKNALIVVYCRTGNRSAKAKTALEGLGYTGVVDFGGISRWTGSLTEKNE